MKRYTIAAGALLLGTSALALAADKAATDPLPTDSEAAVAAVADKPAETKLASVVMDEGKVDSAAAGEAAVTPKSAAVALGEAEPVASGGKDPTMTATLTPRPALENYPPCEPGPGDDNCIQLYEPGVRLALASWNRPTGGLADHSATTAMGGPYEPVETADGKPAAGEAELASVYKPEQADGAMGGPYEPVEAEAEAEADKPAAGEAELASVYKPEGEAAAADEVVHHAAHQGVGGPVEAQSGYPPCEPGPGDDRCIQLYERGVTGAGN